MDKVSLILFYVFSTEDIHFASKCITAIGDIALHNPIIEVQCVRTLVTLLKSGESEIVVSAVISLRKLLYKVLNTKC